MIKRLACVIFLTTFCSGAFAQPTVSVSPTAGPPASRVITGGAGFGSDEAVAIYFDSAELTLAATNPAGTFAGVPLTVPSSAVPGRHWITGIAQHSGLAAQASFVVQTDWPQFLYGPQHRSQNPSENVLNVSNVSTMQVLWRVFVYGFNGFSSVAVANGVLYLSSYANLYALNATTGQQLWKAPIGPDATSPAAVDGIVYVSTLARLY